jgi:dolichol-phosphate mannosyltransferase
MQNENGMPPDRSLVVVCPMANEGEDSIKFVDAVLAHCGQFRSKKFLAILDNATKDNTRELLEAHAKATPELTVIWAPENRSVVDAYLRGYREALALEADWILEIDAGFSHQPSDIPLLFQKMAEGYDCVFGSRFCAGGSIRDSSPLRYWLSYGGTKLTNLLLGTHLHDMTSGFELFRRQALQTVLRRGIQSRGPFFQTEIKTYCRHLLIAEVPIQYRAASHAIGAAAVKDAFRHLWRLFRLRLAGEV